MMQIIVKKPIISEKSMKEAGRGFYSFVVDRNARKTEIGKTISKLFGVTVVAVKTANFKEEFKMQRGRRATRRVAGYKKAVVTLKPGQKISVFDVEKPKEASGKVEVKESKSLLKGTKVKIEKQSTEEKSGKAVAGGRKTEVKKKGAK